MRMKSSLLTTANHLQAMTGELVVTNPEAGPQRSTSDSCTHKTRHAKKQNKAFNQCGHLREVVIQCN